MAALITFEGPYALFYSILEFPNQSNPEHIVRIMNNIALGRQFYMGFEYSVCFCRELKARNR